MQTKYLWPDRRPLDPDRPSLMLFHGFTGCARVWDDVIGSLSGDFNCIAIDLPGHGGNAQPGPAEMFTFSGVLETLRGFLDELPLERVGVWGYSMGGRIALEFALAHPDRVESLILESASPGIKDERERLNRREDDGKLAAQIPELGVATFVDQWMAQPLFLSQQSLPDPRRQEGRVLRMRNTATGLSAALLGFSVGRQESRWGALHQLTMPVLILAGGLDTKYRLIGESMATSIPGARLHLIPDAGHAPHWERPSQTAEAAADFLHAHAGRIERAR